MRIECTKKFPHPIHVFLSQQHQHMNGQRVVTTVKRRGTGRVDVLDYNDFFQHDKQRETSLNLTIYPGDEIITKCVYANDNPIDIRMGSGTYNEMCNQLISYYPKMSTWLCGLKAQGEIWCGGVTDTMSVGHLNERHLEQSFVHDRHPVQWGAKQPQCDAHA
jgi:hypothetical protein